MHGRPFVEGARVKIIDWLVIGPRDINYSPIKIRLYSRVHARRYLFLFCLTKKRLGYFFFQTNEFNEHVKFDASSLNFMKSGM